MTTPKINMIYNNLSSNNAILTDPACVIPNQQGIASITVDGNCYYGGVLCGGMGGLDSFTMGGLGKGCNNRCSGGGIWAIWNANQYTVDGYAVSTNLNSLRQRYPLL